MRKPELFNNVQLKGQLQPEDELSQANKVNFVMSLGINRRGYLRYGDKDTSNLSQRRISAAGNVTKL